MNKKLIALFIIVSIISIIILTYFTYFYYKENIRNQNLFKNLIIVYILFYISIIILYTRVIIIKKETIKHKFFIFGQIYNLISFLIGFIFFDFIKFDIKNFVSLKLIDKILNILFFPGSYFYTYFSDSLLFLLFS
jgi:hypothetical protein